MRQNKTAGEYMKEQTARAHLNHSNRMMHEHIQRELRQGLTMQQAVNKVCLSLGRSLANDMTNNLRNMGAQDVIATCP